MIPGDLVLIPFPQRSACVVVQEGPFCNEAQVRGLTTNGAEVNWREGGGQTRFPEPEPQSLRRLKETSAGFRITVETTAGGVCVQRPPLRGDHPRAEDTA